MSIHDRQFTEQEEQLERVCASCSSRYSIEEAASHFFESPYNYQQGCATSCLACWLGCGPSTVDINGNILRDLGSAIGPDTHLVVMPLSRIMLSTPIKFQSRAIIYPKGRAKLADLKLTLPPGISNSLPMYQSSTALMGGDPLARSAVVAFSYAFEWDDLWKLSHKNHMEFIRFLSQIADRKCFNLIRYRFCPIGVPDTLPGRAGQLEKDRTISAALVYNAFRHEGGILAGEAFHSVVTKGLGLPINEEEVDYNDFPQDGEVGHVAQHALDLYSQMLQAENPTSQFIQAMGLLEFLAEPSDYVPFKEVAKTVARYVATNNFEYEQLKERFFELTGKKDPVTNEFTGYRTRVVHIGDRLERIVPDPEKRNAIIKELDTYIRVVLDHMIQHSTWGFEEYKDLRTKMQPFNSH
jgi:hypothetical protein